MRVIRLWPVWMALSQSPSGPEMEGLFRRLDGFSKMLWLRKSGERLMSDGYFSEVTGGRFLRGRGLYFARPKMRRLC